MSPAEYFHRIGAPGINAGATEAEIKAAETRLGGCFPEAMRAWFREVNGFEGLAKKSAWQFYSVQTLRTVSDLFHQTEIVVVRDDYPDRQMLGGEYVIFCDALFNVPLYAVNIRPDSPCYAEVVCGSEGDDLLFVTSNFDAFTGLLFEHPDRSFYP